ncbi:hypothetical protein D6764_03925 [Candidatus Woesearchaeota archaeon]|nr:MAG: hypothetical protein D6764_03925 [Candidatus Woesearchaeota archaeon]
MKGFADPSFLLAVSYPCVAAALSAMHIRTVSCEIQQGYASRCLIIHKKKEGVLIALNHFFRPKLSSVLFLAFLIVSVSLASLSLGSISARAEVVAFSKYETDLTLKDGYLHIERSMRLKNIGPNPIIPGELHFKLREEKKGKFFGPSIDNVEASNAYHSKLTTTVLKGQKETDLVVSVWDPLLPGFHYDLYVSYDMPFEPSGLLFYEINVPIEETTIPRQSEVVRFHIPEKYKVTFAPNATVSKQEGQRVIEWKNANLLEFEYSPLPLPKLGIRAVNLFWAVLIALLLAMFIILLKRRW